MKISLIASIGINRELGLKNELLWRIRDDLQNFKKVTMGHHILMGRKTYESIGRPLPGRQTIIVTRGSHQWPNCHTAGSPKAGIRFATEAKESELFIIGGSEIYNSTIELADELYLTVINDTKDADAFFPTFDHLFEFDQEILKSDENRPTWSIQRWKKKYATI